MARIPGVGLVKGLSITLRHMLRRSNTQQYPEVRPDLPPRSRGVIALVEENCTSCMLCARECPDWCIYIDSHKETLPAPQGGRPRQRNVLDRFAIDFSLCMYCGICIEVCPFDALFWSPEFEYAEGDIRDLLHEKERLASWVETVPPPPAHEVGAEPPRELTATPRGPASGSRTAAGPRRASSPRTVPTLRTDSDPHAPSGGTSPDPGPRLDPRSSSDSRAVPDSPAASPESGAVAKAGDSAEWPSSEPPEPPRSDRPGVNVGGIPAPPAATAAPVSDATPDKTEPLATPGDTPSDMSASPSPRAVTSGESATKAAPEQTASRNIPKSADSSSKQKNPIEQPKDTQTAASTASSSTGQADAEKLSTGSPSASPTDVSEEQNPPAAPRRRRMIDPRSIRPPGALKPAEPREPEKE